MPGLFTTCMWDLVLKVIERHRDKLLGAYELLREDHFPVVIDS